MIADEYLTLKRDATRGFMSLVTDRRHVPITALMPEFVTVVEHPCRVGGREIEPGERVTAIELSERTTVIGSRVTCHGGFECVVRDALVAVTFGAGDEFVAVFVTSEPCIVTINTVNRVACATADLKHTAGTPFDGKFEVATIIVDQCLFLSEEPDFKPVAYKTDLFILVRFKGGKFKCRICLCRI